jgi:Protein of unknown function (DUF2795)
LFTAGTFTAVVSNLMESEIFCTFGTMRAHTRRESHSCAVTESEKGGNRMAGRGGGASLGNVTQSLSGINFPCQKENLIEHAEQNGAKNEMLELLRHMPEGIYNSMADVMKGYGKAYASRAQSGPDPWRGFRAQYAQAERRSHNNG